MAGAGVVGDERGRAAHPGVLLDARRDLLQLDAVAAQFDLVVGTADELQRAVRVPQAHVTGAVEALARGERRVHEPFRGLLGAPEVAARQLDSAQVKFTALADVHGRPVGVEDVGAEAVDGDADRDGRARAAAEGVGVDLVGGGVDGGLGRAVQVDQGDAGQFGEEVAGEPVGEGLAAGEDPLQRGAGRELLGVQQGLEQRRHTLEGGDLARPYRRQDGLGVAVDAGAPITTRAPVAGARISHWAASKLIGVFCNTVTCGPR